MKKSHLNALLVFATAFACALGLAIEAQASVGGRGRSNSTAPATPDNGPLPQGIKRNADGTPPIAYTLPSANPPADREAMLKQLGIVRTRRGLSSDPGTGPLNANYDEAHVDEWPPGYQEALAMLGKKRPPHASTALPELLTCNDGTRVIDAKTWTTKRRPEIVEEFEREVYGRVPKNAPKVTWEVVSDAVRGSLRTKHLHGHIDNSAYPQVQARDITLTVNTPANATGPVPIVMTFGGAGGFGTGPGAGEMKQNASADGLEGFTFEAALNTPFADLENHERLYPIAAPASGGTTSGPSAWGGARGSGSGSFSRGSGPNAPSSSVFYSKGWGTASIGTDFQPSNWSGGVLALCRQGAARKPDDWGVLRAWAWGVSRAMDYLGNDKDVDAGAVALQGSNYLGKTALVAAAFEPRIFTAFVSSAGIGGAKIWRRNYGELAENLGGTQEYYQVCGNFLKYTGPLTVDDLPVDAHEFVALLAPRPIFIGAGKTEGTGGDGWQDPRGIFLAAQAAGPAWEILAKKGLRDKDAKRVTEFPAIETPLIGGDVAYREQSGRHDDGSNWLSFAEFCTHYWKVNPPAAP